MLWKTENNSPYKILSMKKSNFILLISKTDLISESEITSNKYSKKSTYS